MACYLTVSAILLFLILFVVPFIETNRCWKKCTFQDVSLNSSISSNFCASSTESNPNNINQDCVVKLQIDFTTGFINGSFDAKNQSFWPDNQLYISTDFSLDDSSIKVDITYTCSMSDYCDIEFVRETLSPALATIRIESFRQTLINRLYNSNNTNPIQCSNNDSCPENSTFCYGMYTHDNGREDDTKKVESGCADLTNYQPRVIWTQHYTPHLFSKLTEIGVFFCNIPNCASNGTVIETFQWLRHAYILPLNFSIINVTTTTVRPTTATTTNASTISTTNPNDASLLFGHFNIIVQCSVILLFLYQNLFQIY